MESKVCVVCNTKKGLIAFTTDIEDARNVIFKEV